MFRPSLCRAIHSFFFHNVCIHDIFLCDMYLILIFFSREDLLRSLNTVLECLSGAGAVLPMWEGENIQM